MRLPDLPPTLRTRSALDLIVADASRLMKLNEATQLLSKARFAQVAVEIGLDRPS